MSDVKWIKLKTAMFDDDKIKVIQAMPEGDSLIVIWIRLLILAGISNADGYLMIADNLPYTEEMLATVFNKPLAIIRLAIKTFETFGMIEANNDGIYIQNFAENQSEKLQDIREYNRIKKAESRERAKQKRIEMSNQGEIDNSDCAKDKSLTGQDYVNDQSRTSQRQMSTCQEVDIDKEYKEISPEGEIKKERDSPARPKTSREPIAYQQIMDDYNAVCVDLPPICTLSVERKRKLKTLMSGMDKDRIMPGKSVYERLHAIFQKAHDSDFVSGRDGRWKGCSFDWLINKSNALKVLEGTYANRAGKDNVFSNFPQRNYDFERMEREILNGGKT